MISGPRLTSPPPRAVTLGVALAAAAGIAQLGPGVLAQRARFAPVDTYRVVKAYPHDAQAYTQGLIYRDGVLYESTGLRGRSSLRKVKLATGEVLQQRRLDSAYFGEGLVDWRGQLIQLTWQSNVALVYDLAGFVQKKTFTYPGEGWGLTRTADALIMSDGTDQLRVLDPETFRELRRIRVTDGGAPVMALNELEFVRGEIFANVFQTDRIARISPETGKVTAWLDLKGLMSGGFRLAPDAVLNGIAYDAAGHRLFVTGKLWPRLFEIAIVPRRSPAR